MTTNPLVTEASVQHFANTVGQKEPAGSLCPLGYKQMEEGVIPEDWEVCLFYERIEIAQGQVNPLQDPYKSMVLIGPKHVESATGKLIFTETASEQNAISGKYLFKKGDVLYGKINPYLMKATLAEFDGLCSADMYPLRPKEGLCSGFLLAVILGETFTQYAVSVSARSGMPKINRKEFSEFKFLVPSKQSEQNAIANALSDVDALINELEKLIAKKQAIKTATLQQLLTGRTRLPQFALREDGTKKGYKQSELGEIPEDWEVVSIRQTGDVVTGGTPSTSVIQYWNGDIPWITPSDINGLKDISSSDREISVLGLEMIRGLPGNTVLVTCIASIGKNAILRKPGACNQQINAVIPRKDINVDFLYYAIENSKDRLKGCAGITATPIISKALFEEFLLVIPKTQEQTAIATILSDMDTDIQTLQQRLSKTCQIKQGMMQELLTGKTRLLPRKPEAG